MMKKKSSRMGLSGQLKADLVALQKPSSEFFYLGRSKACTDTSVIRHGSNGGVCPDSNEGAKEER